MGYLTIKNVLDRADVDYRKKEIVQSSDLKEKIELLGIKKDEYTVFSVDAVNMYPSITFNMVREAVLHFAEYPLHYLPELRPRIEIGLDFIRFGMANTIIQFDGSYYKVDGDLNEDERGLTIGGYESAWLADLVMSYFLDKMKKSTWTDVEFFGIYRDDGICIVEGDWSPGDVQLWLNRFQEQVDANGGGGRLKFTAEIWLPEEKALAWPWPGDSNVTVNPSQAFPFLDTEMSWDGDDNLRFDVHMKPNQALKYLNKGSLHPPACFKAITNGVCQRLTKLTTLDERNENYQLHKFYPDHFEALRHAELHNANVNGSPRAKTMKEIVNNRIEVSDKVKKRRAKDRKRALYFVVCYDSFWKTPIHKIIEEVRKRFPSLSWVRVSMSYRRFPNVRELLQGDLNRKIADGLVCDDFRDWDCNCRNRKTEGCKWGGKCRESLTVYEVKCLQTGKLYRGSTQQMSKKRLQAHIQDVKKAVVRGVKSDSFAAHFKDLIPANTPWNEVGQHIQVESKALWKGNPVLCVKTFGSDRCILCAKERVAILNLTRLNKSKAINKCNEIFGACRHKPRFLGYEMSKMKSGNKAHTDESSGQDERIDENSTNETSEGGSAEMYVNLAATVDTEIGDENTVNGAGTVLQASENELEVDELPLEVEPDEEFIRGYVPTRSENEDGFLWTRVNQSTNQPQMRANTTASMLPEGYDVENSDEGDLPPGLEAGDGVWI